MKNLVRRARLVSEYFVRALTLQGLSQQIYIQRAVWIGVLEELSCLRKCFLHVCTRGKRVLAPICKHSQCHYH